MNIKIPSRCIDKQEAQKFWEFVANPNSVSSCLEKMERMHHARECAACDKLLRSLLPTADELAAMAEKDRKKLVKS